MALSIRADPRDLRERFKKCSHEGERVDGWNTLWSPYDPLAHARGYYGNSAIVLSNTLSLLGEAWGKRKQIVAQTRTHVHPA